MRNSREDKAIAKAANEIFLAELAKLGIEPEEISQREAALFYAKAYRRAEAAFNQHIDRLIDEEKEKNRE